MTVHTPIETSSRSIPPWAIGITVLIFLVGGVYLAGNLSGENPPIGGVPSPSGSAGGPVLSAAGAVFNPNVEERRQWAKARRRRARAEKLERE